jgi:protein-S-isoprenylcysteine O-methyltransferase Ste14
MAALLGYAALLAIAYDLFVRYHEEPTLGRLFGEPYARYRKAVSRRVPRRPGRTSRHTCAGERTA